MIPLRTQGWGFMEGGASAGGRQGTADTELAMKEKQPLPWRLNSARVPGGKKVPGWDWTVQLLRLLVGADPEVWACGSSQLPRRRQPSRAGTSWSRGGKGRCGDVATKTSGPVFTLSSLPSETQALGLSHTTLMPLALGSWHSFRVWPWSPAVT